LPAFTSTGREDSNSRGAPMQPQIGLPNLPCASQYQWLATGAVPPLRQRGLCVSVQVGLDFIMFSAK
jgi:hypothetical protein